MDKGNGLTTVKRLYQEPGHRARQLKDRGTKAIGYYCCFSPAEIITAANILPYRIRGDIHESINAGDAYLDINVCPYLRSTFDLAIKGRYDFLDGIVVPSSCRNITRFHVFWKDYVRPAYTHYINVPHTLRPSSFDFLQTELADFKKDLEVFAGVQISDQSLYEAIELHNENRRLLRKLCELRKPDPPLLSGVEMLEAFIAGVSVPVDEANELLKHIIKDITSRRDGCEKKVRLLIYGSVIDNTDLIRLVENCGANVVIDDLCFGTRAYWQDVEIGEDPLASLAGYYLDKIMCPRTYRKTIEERFGHIRRFVEDFQVDGVIFDAVRFCDPVKLEIPGLKEYLHQAGLPALLIEDDYNASASGALKTRVQAFVELLRH